MPLACVPISLLLVTSYTWHDWWLGIPSFCFAHHQTRPVIVFAINKALWTMGCQTYILYYIHIYSISYEQTYIFQKFSITWVLVSGLTTMHWFSFNCLFSLSTSCWSKSLFCWPDIDFPMLTMLMILTCLFSCTSITRWISPSELFTFDKFLLSRLSSSFQPTISIMRRSRTAADILFPSSMNIVVFLVVEFLIESVWVFIRNAHIVNWARLYLTTFSKLIYCKVFIDLCSLMIFYTFVQNQLLAETSPVICIQNQMWRPPVLRGTPA